jgi:hypothetical protein
MSPESAGVKLPDCETDANSRKMMNILGPAMVSENMSSPGAFHTDGAYRNEESGFEYIILRIDAVVSSCPTATTYSTKTQTAMGFEHLKVGQITEGCEFIFFVRLKGR